MDALARQMPVSSISLPMTGADLRQVIALFTEARRIHRRLSIRGVADGAGVTLKQAGAALRGRPVSQKATNALLVWNDLPCDGAAPGGQGDE